VTLKIKRNEVCMCVPKKFAFFFQVFVLPARAFFQSRASIVTRHVLADDNLFRALPLFKPAAFQYEF